MIGGDREREAADVLRRGGWTVLRPEVGRPLRCGSCGHAWRSRVPSPKFCPRCHRVTVRLDGTDGPARGAGP